ncbi:hypothetical protein A2961_02525 [Candidatus Woesebacteria bacterium RIFCSPLOWO2_01_FULL_39_21]|uniref:Plasmid stabilization protein n=1 Tax=Candidatus Woesebacteria bacterium RIFCSPLOWO2_01_FULL_39_21 TaxID=1802519 RepID=A0A1F8BDP3_9BACT|nr:MAG: hypothetical protein A2691_01570 [Candidatus Woesebacteria bacterium RIFCSPHIGHO2_01_FULL_39_23]OGM61789.1 MAG: hypothetical protein A2961_02525 [Candidatus Woesebacteria bacterium RIFCSPLOWO2_01_FULL_39_21]
MPYKVFHHKLFEREVLKIPAHHQSRIHKIVSKLKEDPNKLPSNTEPLSGYKGCFRTRIGSLRLIYFVNHEKEEVLILGIRPRGDIYKVIRRLLS